MSDKKDYEHINDLRKRLYDRNFGGAHTTPRATGHVAVDDVSRGWDVKPVAPPPSPPLPASTMIAPTDPFAVPALTIVPPLALKKKANYRLFLLLGSLGIFIFIAVLSSIYLFFGQNQISAKNITFAITGPVSVSAGDSVPFELAIANQNSVAIESATLIVNYPAGTKTSDAQRDLYEERVPLALVSPGEAIKIPVQAVLYGEENEEKEIKAAIEYRIKDSNGIYYKEAESIKVKINSSPLAMRIDALEKVSSGQELDITLTIASNTTAPQRNILITANYPNSFTFTQAEPSPSYGKNTWIIEEIKPEEFITIKLRGRVDGVAADMSELSFSAGTPRSDNQFIVSTLLSKVATSYAIERPFIDVQVGVNNDTDGDVVLQAGTEAQIVVQVKNTLSESIYDMKIAVTPQGNLIRDDLIGVGNGQYDSRTKTIVWEIASMADLAEVKPGETRTVLFTVQPDPAQTTGSFSISTNISSRRVGEQSAEESVLGRALAEVKYASTLAVQGQVGYNNGAFGDTGPIPPVVDETTTYTITLAAQAGVNGVTGAVMTTTLPSYVTWLDTVEGPGTVTYNPVSKQLRWEAGLIEASASTQLQFQVAVTPNVTQVGKQLVLVGEQTLRGTDRFSDTALSARAGSISNLLSPEAGFAAGNDVVQEE